MKKLFVFIGLVLSSLFSFSQDISDVVIANNSYIKVYDTNNNHIASGYITSSKDDIIKYSDCIIVVIKTNGYIKIYDGKLNHISTGYIGNFDYNVNVVGCNILCKNIDGYKRNYDKRMNLISTTY